MSGASGEALEQLKEKAKEMGAKTKFSGASIAACDSFVGFASLVIMERKEVPACEPLILNN